MGSPNAKVTVEEFADFQCGSCAATHPIMNEIKAMYGTRIHFIYRNFPLKIPAHDKSYEAAIAAEAAGAQGKFWEMQNMLFTHQQDWTKAPTFRDIWKGYAQTIGLNVPKWEAEMGGIAAEGRVKQDMERGNVIGINSTPSIFINNVSVPYTSATVDGLKALIDAELQKGAPGALPAGGDSKPPANAANAAQ
jgi:protein-disulfide isomerase